jgi:hypothetical protein
MMGLLGTVWHMQNERLSQFRDELKALNVLKPTHGVHTPSFICCLLALIVCFLPGGLHICLVLCHVLCVLNAVWRFLPCRYLSTAAIPPCQAT